MKKISGLILASILAVLLALPTPAHAANSDDFNLTTSPLPVLLTAKPGTSTSTALRIQNSGTKPALLHVSLLKFKADGKNGHPILQLRGPGDDYFDWVKFNTTAFTAQPGVWNQINMTVNVPPTGALGYYYAVVFSRQDPKANPTSPSSQLQGGTAILVLLDVPVPGEKKQLNISSFTADKKLYEYLPATFTTTIKNTGDIHLVPNGSIFITRGGKTVATLDVNPASGNVLPDSSRQFLASWNDGFPVFETKTVGGQIVSKDGKPVKSLNWNFAHANRLRFGHYTAHLVMAYDNGTRDVPIEGEVSFWVVPWKILPFIILAIVLIGIGLWTSGKSTWRKVAKRKPKK